MSFKEIGQRLGISKQCAYQHYQNALRKLHCRPGAARILHQLGAEIDRQMKNRALESSAQMAELVHEARRGNL
jgi:DNA-binding NarL/FixJ family response regulator